MGGHVQPQILAQVFSHLMAGASAQDAVGTPRFTVGAWDEGDPADSLRVESDIDPEVLHELDMFQGPRTVLNPLDSSVGHAHAIHVSAAGFDTGTDPRADG
jgi:gamma-glutamyltranspeptidase